jgi:dethiobiotin synthase
MTKGVFITGSGTNVGKTHISKLLLKGYSKLGCRATYMKPVETGCAEAANGEVSAGADTLGALEFVSCKADDLTLHSPYRFVPACSPHLAAKMSRREISIERIVSAYDDLKKAAGAQITIVEGAGGLLVPINDNGQYVADVIKALAVPAILVVTPELGTLNHTFMSLRILKQYEIPAAGVIINNPRGIERDFIYEDNVKTITRHVGPTPCLDVDFHGASAQNLPSGEPIFTEIYHEIASSN